MNWKTLHHANLYSKVSKEEIWNSISQDLSFVKTGNPDVLDLELPTLGIDEARDLSTWAYKKSFGERKIAVISASSFTTEAQNALLKLFEEPPQNTYFFVILENASSVLPTLLSRMRILGGGGSVLEIEKEENNAINFINSDLSARFKIINPIIKNKDREAAKNLVFAILSELRKTKNKTEILQNLLKAESYLAGRAPSIKMIMENVAINL